MKNNHVAGLIFDIQGYSVHDGPGCRTLVFLAGCPLRCEWCANPEGMELRQKVLYRESKCKYKERGCTGCITACPYGAIRIDDTLEPPVQIDRSQCSSCSTFACTTVCLHEALVVCGKWMTLKELMGIINRDRQFWGAEGGVTFTGGEPLVQKDFLIKVLEQCREAYIHTAMETSAYAPKETFLEVIKYLEWIFIDIKHMDPEKHREKTGVSNEIILGNIAALAVSDWPGRLIARMPVIEGFNDTEENVVATAEFLNKIGLEEINILPFHRLGESKWRQLGKTYLYRDQEWTPEEKLKRIKEIFNDYNLVCYIGHETPF